MLMSVTSQQLSALTTTYYMYTTYKSIVSVANCHCFKLVNSLVHTADDVPQPTSPPSTPFLNSPYVYILVLAVLAVVPVVVGIALCKKAWEKKSKVQYARGEQLSQKPRHHSVYISAMYSVAQENSVTG